jgi:hypothetical protein
VPGAGRSNPWSCFAPRSFNRRSCCPRRHARVTDRRQCHLGATAGAMRPSASTLLEGAVGARGRRRTRA